MKALKPILYLRITLTFIIILVFSCKNKTGQTTQIQQIPVVKAIQHDIPVYEWYVGQIYGKKDIPIRARVDGFLESIDFKEGSRVQKGQLLYTVDPQSLEEATNAQQSKVSEAQTQLTKAKADLARIKPLAESKAVSKSDLDAAQAAYDAAKANLAAAHANLRSSKINLGYTKIVSPIDGIIGKTEAQVGEYVGRAPNPVILNTVSEVDTVLVKFSIPEAMFITAARHYEEYKKLLIDSVYKEIKLQLADGSIYPNTGKIDFINRNVDQSTGSILIQASFPNSDKLLRPGLYSKVRVLTGFQKNAVVIPLKCLIETQGSFSVFTVNDSNMVESQAIKILHKSGDIAAIKEGLEPGDKVVIDAIQKVRNGIKVSPQDTTFQSQVFKLN